MKFTLDENNEWQLVPETKPIGKTVLKISVVGFTLFLIAYLIDIFLTGGVLVAQTVNFFQGSLPLFKMIKTYTLKI